MVTEPGIQRRLIDGMLAKAAKRVDDTAAHTYGSDRSAAGLCERVVGMSSGEAKRAIDIAAKLESLPATDVAVRAGRLSTRQVDLIVATASVTRRSTESLIAAASASIASASQLTCLSAGAVGGDPACRDELARTSS